MKGCRVGRDPQSPVGPPAWNAPQTSDDPRRRELERSSALGGDQALVLGRIAVCRPADFDVYKELHGQAPSAMAWAAAPTAARRVRSKARLSPGASSVTFPPSRSATRPKRPQLAGSIPVT